MLVISHRSAAYRQTHIEPLIMCCDKNQIGSIFGEWRKKAQTPILTSRSGGCTFLPFSLSSLCSCSLFVDFLISVLTVFFLLCLAFQFWLWRVNLHVKENYTPATVIRFPVSNLVCECAYFQCCCCFCMAAPFHHLSLYALFKRYRKLILSLAFNIRCWVLGTRSHLRIQVHIKALLD